MTASLTAPPLLRPGLREKDFVRYAGRLVELKFFKPQSGLKQITGALVGLRDGHVRVTVNDKEQEYPQEEVAQIRLHVSMGSTKK